MLDFKNISNNVSLPATIKWRMKTENKPSAKALLSYSSKKMLACKSEAKQKTYSTSLVLHFIAKYPAFSKMFQNYD